MVNCAIASELSAVTTETEFTKATIARPLFRLGSRIPRAGWFGSWPACTTILSMPSTRAISCARDCALANGCLDYLNYDRLGRREVHRHLSSGDAELQRWIEDNGLCARCALTA